MPTEGRPEPRPPSRLRDALRWYLSTWTPPRSNWRGALTIAAWVVSGLGLSAAGSYAREAARAGIAWRELLVGWALRAGLPLALILAITVRDLRDANRTRLRSFVVAASLAGLLAILFGSFVRALDPDLGAAIVGTGMALVASGSVGAGVPPWRAITWSGAWLGLGAWIALARP